MLYHLEKTKAAPEKNKIYLMSFSSTPKNIPKKYFFQFTVILTPSTRPPNEPLTHVMSFTLRGLQSGSVYEAIVQAKNRYGWNEVSRTRK